MNLREAMTGIRETTPPGAVEAWLKVLDGEDRTLADYLLYERHPIRSDRYRYSSREVAATLAKVGLAVNRTTIDEHRRRVRETEST